MEDILRFGDTAVIVGEISYWGNCPRCGVFSGVVACIGREHWMYCDADRVKWHLGSNLFSFWRELTPEDWQRAAEHLEPYEEVEPIYPYYDDKGLFYADGKAPESSEELPF